MAKRRHSELASGVFVLIALAAGVGALIWLGAADVLKQRGQKVVFYVPQARGHLSLEVGSAVKVNDAPVGKINSIHFDPDTGRTLYETRLEDTRLRVRADARAKAVAEFIGGASVVLEDFGSDLAPLAGPENPVPLTEGIGSMFRQARETLGYGEQQRQQFQQALVDVSAAANDVRRITGAIVTEVDTKVAAALLPRSKATAANLKSSSENLLTVSRALRTETDKTQAGALLQKAHAVADYAKSVSQNAAEMVAEIRPDARHVVVKLREYTDKDVAEILASLRKTNNTLVEIVGDVRTLTSKARDIVVLNRDTIDQIILNIKTMSLNLTAAAKEIRRNPWRLLRRPLDKHVESQNIYDAARAFAEGAEQLDAALMRLRALRDARAEGVRAGDPELKKILKHVQGTFEKFRTVEDALWRQLSD